MPWDSIPTGWIPGGGLATVALSGFWLVFRGLLVPRSTLDDVRTDRDTRVAEARADRDSWREAFTVSEKARNLTEQQIGKLLDYASSTDAMLRDLPRSGQRGSR